MTIRTNWQSVSKMYLSTACTSSRTASTPAQNLGARFMDREKLNERVLGVIKPLNLESYMSINPRALLKLAAIIFVFPLLAFAQTQQPPDPPAGFDKIEEMVPMRDGVKLHTII